MFVWGIDRIAIPRALRATGSAARHINCSMTPHRSAPGFLSVGDQV
jgi:hypothetical protein